jgi:hypothetical protein
MKRLPGVGKLLLGLLILGLLLLGAILSYNLAMSWAYSPTPTPDLSLIPIPPRTPAPTHTPIAVSKVTDLAPDLPDSVKYEVYVRHADGSVEMFLVAPFPPNAQVSSVVPLKEGDVLLGVNHKRKPPEPTP